MWHHSVMHRKVFQHVSDWHSNEHACNSARDGGAKSAATKWADPSCRWMLLPSRGSAACTMMKLKRSLRCDQAQAVEDRVWHGVILRADSHALQDRGPAQVTRSGDDPDLKCDEVSVLASLQSYRPFLVCASWRLTTGLAIGRWPAAACGPVPLCLMRAHAASRLEQMPARTHPTHPAAWPQSPRTTPLRSTATYPPSRRHAACFHGTLLALLPVPATLLQMAVFALCAFLLCFSVSDVLH